MKSRTRIMIVIIIGIILLILIGIILYKVVYFPSNEGEDGKQVNVGHLTVEYKTLDNCYDELNCEVPYSDYATLSTDISSNRLKNIMDELNTKIDNLYNKSLNSTDMSNAECSNVSNLYQRSIMVENNLITYDNDGVLGLTLLSRETNLCTSISNEEFDSYLYDIENDKILTNDDIKEKYDITDEIISSTIEANINAINVINGVNYTTNITDYSLYIETDGTIGIYYMQPEDGLYYNILLDKSVK